MPLPCTELLRCFPLPTEFLRCLTPAQRVPTMTPPLPREFLRCLPLAHRVPMMPPPCPESSYDASPMPTEFLECLPHSLCSVLVVFLLSLHYLRGVFSRPIAFPILASPSP